MKKLFGAENNPAPEIKFSRHVSVAEYNRLREAVGWQTCDPRGVRRALRRSDFLVAAKAGGQTVGLARVMQDGLQALVMDVMVLPEFQGRGIGSALMERVMAYLRKPAQDGGIFVNLMAAKGREEFYTRFGFERRPNDTRGPGMQQWISGA